MNGPKKSFELDDIIDSWQPTCAYLHVFLLYVQQKRCHIIQSTSNDQIRRRPIPNIIRSPNMIGEIIQYGEFLFFACDE